MSKFKNLVVGQEIISEGVAYVVDEIKTDGNTPGVWMKPTGRRFVSADCIDEEFDWCHMEKLYIGERP